VLATNPMRTDVPNSVAVLSLEISMTTILIIVVLFLLIGGGGYYGYRRR
jgi:LPXTG-motif cell wall-anchored protein